MKEGACTRVEVLAMLCGKLWPRCSESPGHSPCDRTAYEGPEPGDGAGEIAEPQPCHNVAEASPQLIGWLAPLRDGLVPHSERRSVVNRLSKYGRMRSPADKWDAYAGH
jgi:hypothetical protein